MKFIRSITTISGVLAISLLSGCGSSETQKSVEKAYKIDVPLVHKELKITRDVDADNEIDIMEEGNRIVFEIFGDAEHSDFFINSDDDINSGHKRTQGADYLIENGNLFIHQGTGWNWIYVKRVDIEKGENSVKMTLDKSDLRNLDSNIKAIGMQFDANWNTVRLTNSVQLQITNNTNNNVTNNLDIDENNVNMSANFTNDSLHIQASSESNPKKTHGVVFMDTDKDGTTGLRRYGIGSDYLVQDGMLFRYTGHGTNWSWNYIGRFGTKDTNSFSAIINPNQIGGSTSIDFVAQYYNSAWNRFDSTPIHSIGVVNETRTTEEIIEENIIRLISEGAYAEDRNLPRPNDEFHNTVFIESVTLLPNSRRALVSSICCEKVQFNIFDISDIYNPTLINMVRSVFRWEENIDTIKIQNGTFSYIYAPLHAGHRVDEYEITYDYMQLRQIKEEHIFHLEDM